MVIKTRPRLPEGVNIMGMETKLVNLSPVAKAIIVAEFMVHPYTLSQRVRSQ
tara:strand:+ start:1194 stop:1349 length:156 start_codon:yes stop_codon:yes gene_type:complete